MTLTARDIMTTDPVTVSPETSIAVASRLLLERRFNGLPVVDTDGALVGVLCQSDLIMQHKQFQVPSFFFLFDGFFALNSAQKLEEQVKKMSALHVAQAMTNNPRVVSPDTPIDEIATLMVDDKFHTLPVVEAGKLIGIVGKEDVLRTMVRG